MPNGHTMAQQRTSRTKVWTKRGAYLTRWNSDRERRTLVLGPSDAVIE